MGARRLENLRVSQTARIPACGVDRPAERQCLANYSALPTRKKHAAVGIDSDFAEGFERGMRRQPMEDRAGPRYLDPTEHDRERGAEAHAAWR